MLTLIPICSDGLMPTLKSAEPGLQDTDAKKLYMIFMATLLRPYTLQKGPPPLHGSTVAKRVHCISLKDRKSPKKSEK